MSSTIWPTARWYLYNLLLLYATAFVAALIWGTVAVVTSSDGKLSPQSTGSAAEQVFWWAVGLLVFAVSWAAPLALAVALLGLRFLVSLIGHPRRSAYLVAAAAVVALVVLIPGTDPLFVFALAAPPAFVYASIMRLPDGRSPRGSEAVPVA